jgi:hypothetical protein
MSRDKTKDHLLRTSDPGNERPDKPLFAFNNTFFRTNLSRGVNHD